jgi:hypothetical protein
MREEEIVTGLQPGQGVNVDLKTSHGFAVDGEFTLTLPTAAGVTVVYTLTVVRTADDLMKTLSVSANVSYAGIFSASASADFNSMSSFSKYSTFVVAKCVVSLPSQTISRPSINPKVIEQAKNMTRDEFAQQYGTEFLAGITTGGVYYGVIEIESTSQKQQDDIAVAVSGSGWGVSTDTKISTSIATASQKATTRVFAIRRGGAATIVNPKAPDEIIRQAIEFGEHAEAHPVAIMGLYQRYEDMSAIRFADKSLEGEDRQRDLELLGRRYVELCKLRNDFDFVRRHYNDHLTGSGVTFSVGGHALRGKPLSSAPAPTLKRLKLASSNAGSGDEAREKDAPDGSAPITIQAVQEELKDIEESIREVRVAAEKCKEWRRYTIPEPYIARIALPEIEGTNMELEQMKQSLVPARTILLWSGNIETIPNGWLLCDGTRGTPDLRDRFVCGAGREGVGPTATASGEADVHDHGMPGGPIVVETAIGGKHSHAFPGSWYRRDLHGGDWTGIDTGGENVAKQRVSEDGAHTHGVSIQLENVTTLKSVAGRPKWYALCYIMKASVAQEGA